MREIGPDETGRLYGCLEALAEHHNRVSVYFKGRYPAVPSAEKILRFMEELERGGSFIAVTEDGPDVTGFCKISVSGRAGVLEYLVVLERERGKGRGAELMDWAMDRFRKLGAEDVEVRVVYGNAASGLYEKYGFRPKSVIMGLRL